MVNPTGGQPGGVLQAVAGLVQVLAGVAAIQAGRPLPLLWLG